MHHYGEDSTDVVESKFAYHVVFRNKETGALITMQIPREGALEKAGLKLDSGLAWTLAGEIAHMLRRVLK